MLINKGVQLEAAATASIVRVLDVVFAFVWQVRAREVHVARQLPSRVELLVQVLLLGDLPNAFSVLGAMIVTSAVLAVGVRKYLQARESSGACCCLRCAPSGLTVTRLPAAVYRNLVEEVTGSTGASSAELNADVLLLEHASRDASDSSDVAA